MANDFNVITHYCDVCQKYEKKKRILRLTKNLKTAEEGPNTQSPFPKRTSLVYNNSVNCASNLTT